MLGWMVPSTDHVSHGQEPDVNLQGHWAAPEMSAWDGAGLHTLHGSADAGAHNLLQMEI